MFKSYALNFILIKNSCRIILFLSLTFVSKFSIAQINTYTFATGTGMALENMSAGTTTLIGSSVDDGASAVTNIGFTFNYNSINYTQFSVSSNGLMRLGSTLVSSTYSNNLTSGASDPKIAAYWDDLSTGSAASGSKIHYKLVGSSPNRYLVVEFLVVAPYNTGAAYNSRFQVFLYETTNQIKFLYGTVPAGTSYSVGITSSSIDFIRVSGNTAFTTGSSDGQTAAFTSGRYYTFTPANMVYTSSTVSQASTSTVSKCSNDQAIVGVQVVTTGSMNPISLSEIQMNMTGSTAGISDVSKIHVYYTGTSPVFSATSAFDGIGTTPSAGTITITGTQQLSPGTNYFWIAYDLNLSSTTSNVVDGQCTQVKVAGTNYVPSITNPAGSRTIVACVPSPGGVSSGLSIWLKPSSGVTTSGVNVTSWTNQVSGGPTITVAGSPDYLSNGYNYNPYIEFTLSGGTGGDYLTFPNTNLQSFFYVAKLDDLTRKSTHLATYNDVTFGAPCGSCALHGGENGGAVAQYFESGYGSGNFQAAGVWRKNGAATAYNTNHSGQYDIITTLGQASASCNSLMGGQTNNLPSFNGRLRDWDGPVGEIINYTGAITTSQANKIESYLGIKHGITLGGNGNASIGYVNTSGTTIWTAGSGFHYDVTGIGNEVTIELLQQNKSKSINVPSAAGATDMPFIIAHDDMTTPTDIEEGAYVIVGHDNGTLALNSVSYTHQNTVIEFVQNRIFRIQTTGITGGKAMTALKIQVDMTQVSGYTGLGLGGANDPNNLCLLLDGNNTFGEGSGVDTDERVYMLESISGNIVNFSIPVSDLPNTGVHFFRFGSVLIPPVPLAIVMGDVNIECGDLNPVLNWETNSEFQLNYFDIQVSKDGVDFQSLIQIYGEIQNESGASYKVDLPNYTQLSYVKIIEVNQNLEGTTYGPYVYNCSEDEILLFPNPAENYLIIEAAMFEAAIVQIIDKTGRVVYEKSHDLSMPNQIPLEIAQGVYTINIFDQAKAKKLKFSKL
jgi:hypothetical protein